MRSSDPLPSPDGSPRAGRAEEAPARQSRELGVDLARGVALLSMFVAHTAPSQGPYGVLTLSEYLTFPLFALLVGVGAALGARAHSAVPHLVRSLVAGAALVGIGWLLDGAGAHVVIVLGQLGLLTVLMWAVAHVPSLAVLGVGGLAAALAPWTLEASADSMLHLALAGESDAMWWLNLWVSHAYPQAVLVSLGCLGVVGARWVLLRERQPSTALLAGVATTLLLGVTVVMLSNRLDVVELVPYRTAPLEQVVIAALAVGVALGCVVAARLRWGPIRMVLRAVAAAGAMTLTLYTVHVFWLAHWVIALRPGEGDDTWVNVVGMSVAALVLAGLWQGLRLPRPWRRGPLEGSVAVVGDLLAAPWERAGRRASQE